VLYFIKGQSLMNKEIGYVDTRQLAPVELHGTAGCGPMTSAAELGLAADPAQSEHLHEQGPDQEGM